MKKQHLNGIGIREKNRSYILILICILIVVVSTILVSCRTNNITYENASKSSILNDKQPADNEVETLNNLQLKASKDTVFEVDADELMALSITEKFCNDMTKSWLELERVDMSNYLVDNLDTHLILNWIDFDIADRLQNTWRQLVSIDSIVISNNKFKKPSENNIVYEAFVEIKYTRYEPSVNGIGIDLSLSLHKIDGVWMIASADIIGASIYKEWKESHYTTIKEMDKAFLDSCKQRGIMIKP